APGGRRAHLSFNNLRAANPAVGISAAHPPAAAGQLVARASEPAKPEEEAKRQKSPGANSSGPPERATGRSNTLIECWRAPFAREHSRDLTGVGHPEKGCSASSKLRAKVGVSRVRERSHEGDEGRGHQGGQGRR